MISRGIWTCGPSGDSSLPGESHDQSSSSLFHLFLLLGLVPRSFLPFLLSKVGPEMGEDIDVVLEKGKVLHIKTLTPGIEVGDLHHDVLDSSICVFGA